MDQNIFRVVYAIPALLLCVTATAQNPLNIPPTLSGAEIDLTLQTGSVQFLSGQPTETMGVNGALLGPTIVLENGQEVTINVHNELGETTTIHWHGMHVPPEDDGGPHTPIADGASWSPAFTVMDRASTHWYHPHLHMHTNAHVVKGIAGLILVHDEEEAALTLPRTYGVDDLPLVVQTKEFDSNNQVVIGGALDDQVMVNGTLDPFVEVPAQMVRLRLLNGASERVFNFGFANNLAFQQIGSDGGLLTAPLAMTRLRLGPGERAEIVLDLGGLEGQSLQLMSYGAEIPSAYYGAAQPGMGPGQTIPNYNMNPLNGNNYDVLRLDVGAPTSDPVTTLPTTLTTHTPWLAGDADITRNFTFTPVNMGPTAIQGPFLINGATYDMMNINFDVPYDNIEIWQLTNQSPIAHPFHIHDVQFYILDINGVAPPANLQGLKDVVLVPAGNSTVRFITQFTDHYSEEIPYMYHCHMLTHEDDGMMGQFRVMPPAGTGFTETGSLPGIRAYPNPADRVLQLHLPIGSGYGIIHLSDALGRQVGTVPATGTPIELPVGHLAPGAYVATFVGNQGSYSVRFVRQKGD